MYTSALVRPLYLKLVTVGKTTHTCPGTYSLHTLPTRRRRSQSLHPTSYYSRTVILYCIDCLSTEGTQLDTPLTTG